MYLDQSSHIPYMGYCVVLNMQSQEDQTTLCTVADCSGEVEVIVPSSAIPSIESIEIPLTGLPTEIFMNCSHGTALPMKINIGKGRETLGAIPAVFCPESHKVYHKELMTLLQDHVVDPRCHKLLASILSDEFIAIQFQTIPASGKIHHTEDGGLLRHTLEVVKEVLHSPTFESWDTQTQSLALTAATLHDIGKCHKRYGKFSCYGIHHEDRNLELIARPLQTMEESWSDGAELLRLCLVKNTSCNAESPVRTLVRGADHLSASNDSSKKAFANVDDWQSVVKAKAPNHRMYVRAS